MWWTHEIGNIAAIGPAGYHLFEMRAADRRR